MDTHNTREFAFIDAMPGAGKTEYFVQKAAKQITENRKGILVYVAPTTKLLAEAFRRIARVIGTEQASKVVIVSNPFELGSALSKTGYKVRRDQPATALNYLFGLIPRDRYLATTYRAEFSHDCTHELEDGQVVMTTHESFVRLNRQDATGRDFKLLKRMTVIFDEARKCVLHSQELKVPRDQWKSMWTCLKVSPVEDTRERASRFKLFKVESLMSPRDLCKVHGLTLARRSLLPEHMKGMLRLFNKYTRTGRGSLYILSSSDPRAEYQDVEGMGNISIQVVMRPTSLFENYRRVILTSAFFQDSQMYHFLHKDGHKLTPLLEGRELKGALLKIKRRSERLRVAAGERIEVAMLLRDEFYGNVNPAYRNTLSSNLLDKGMVIPIKLAHELIEEEINPALSIDQVIRALATEDKKTKIAKDERVVNQLRQWAIPPLWVLLDEAATIFRNWEGRINEKQRSLLALNVASYRRWAPSSVRYLRMVRFILAHGDVALRGDKSDSDLNDGEHDLDAKLVPELWRKKLKYALYANSDDSVFTVPRTPHLHGINKYDRLNAFTHLAALNPGPSLVSVYHILIPDYDIDQDHSIENLVQTLYRTSLRDPKATEPVLMIVPYEASAELLASKIGVDGFKIHRRAKLAVFHHIKTTRTEDQVVRQREGTRAALTKYDPQYRDELEKLRKRLITAESRLKASPDSARVQATVAKHKKAFEALQKKARLNGK